jgi:hypothetical protein
MINISKKEEIRKKIRIFYLIIAFSTIIGVGIVDAQEKTIDDQLSLYGLEEPKVSLSGNEVLVEYKQPVSELGSLNDEFKKIAKILTTVSDELSPAYLVKIRQHFDDGQIMEVVGKPEDGKAFLNNQISEETFSERLEFKPLTRGPPIIPGMCEPDKGENCENCEECVCYPNEFCDPTNPKANKKGCVVKYIPPNSHLVGSEYVCDEGYEWNSDLTECVTEKKCPPNSFKFQGECYCMHDYKWNPDKTKCILKEVPPKVFTGLTFESRSKPCGSSVQIPLTLNGIEDKIGNIDITLSYDPSVLEATEVIKGDLTTDSLFEYNIMAGTILISLADAEGFSGNGTIAYVTFNVIGAADSTSPLQIAALAANRADDYEALTIPTNDGVFRVESGLTVSVSDTTGAKGSTVKVPINLEGASEVGSMDIVLKYDADVLSAVDVEVGELGKNALIAVNTAREGEVIIALADSSGINGDGAVASVAFEVIGDAGTTSYLTLEAVSVHNLDLGEIIPTTECGTFLVI